ncbi:MAG: diguanylate cyclase, partial [Deltaproteobacteria bacterium]|nr:diguanylate cyclase [Deltaproteobacteria bacterium]
MRGASEALAVLIEVTERFTLEVPLEEVLEDVTGALLELVPGNHSSIRVFDDTRTELICGARSGEGVSAIPVKFMKGEGIIGWVADYGRVARIGDAAKDARFKKPLEEQGFEFSSILAVPLAIGSEVIGVLSVTAKEQNVFKPDDELLARLLANCSVPVIQKNRLERLSLFDDVTQALRASRLLPQAEEELARARREGSPLSVLMVDLDRLQNVYQEFGFPAGDGVMRSFAERVRSIKRPESQLYTRGGGTFVLVMPGAEPAFARDQAEALKRELATRPLAAVEGVAIPMTASIGVCYSVEGESADRLLRRAEAAMAKAREQ